MMRLKHDSKGMTLAEVLISAVVTVIILGSVLGMWVFMQQNWSVERARAALRTDLEIAMEKIREEIRLSSAAYMSLYKPAGGSDYTAISFPVATGDAQGFFTLNTGDTIYWDASVIYHIYENPPSSGELELRRTVFTDNHDELVDTATRESQLASVVTTGDGTSAANSANATTTVVFKNLVDLAITSTAQGFDCYSSTTTRSDSVSFGSISLTSGNHLFTFTVTGQNASSTGYDFAIDTIAISPSGCLREAEYYTGIGTTKVYASGWSGNYYAEYNASAVGDALTFTLYYDLWRETNFQNAIRSNALLTDNNLYVQLADPDTAGSVCWQATTQTGIASQDYPSLGGEPALSNYAIRNVLKGAPGNDYIDIDANQKQVRIKFLAHSTSNLVITSAWLVERSTVSLEDGTGVPVQLLFSGLVGVTIPAGGEQWTDWAEFTIADDKDYLVTFYTTAANFKYWRTGSGTNSYYDADPNDDTSSDDSDASASNWINYTASPYIYGVDSAEQWSSVGTVMSEIYDTKIVSSTLPSYGTISWNSSVPAGTAIGMEVRAGDNEDLSDATSWASVTNGSSLPGAIDGKRYVQFKATLSSSSPYTSYPWIDDVTLDWPGETKMCDISCYFTKKSNYGIVSLTVDGDTPTKAYEFKATVYKYIDSTKYENSLTAEIEPRNTGK